MRRTTLFSVVLLQMFMGAGSAQAATVTVETQDNQFVPADAKVQAGDTVTFKNTGQAPHNAQSPDRKVFIDIINPGESKDVVISEGGTIDYVCTFHQTLGMKGTITVEGAAGAAPAGGAGAPSPGASPGASPAAGGASPSPGATPSPGASPGGEDEAAPGAEEEPPLESPVTEKYLPPIGAAIFVLMLLGLGAPFKQHLKPVLRSVPPKYEPAPVGAPASIASPVTVAAPAAAVATAPPPAAPAPTAAAPAPAAPAPAAPAAPAGPALDPDEVYKAVLAEETGKGTDPRVAEARAKAAQMRTQEAQATAPAAPAAEAPAPAAAPEAAAPAEAPAPAAEAAAAEAPEAAAPEAEEAAAPEAAAPVAPAGKAMSDEEAAEIRRKVYEEEMAKGSDPRVAEGRAKSAELRAKKGTYQPK